MLWPYVAGQSGTAIAASYVVTSAPNDSNTAVTPTSRQATRCVQFKAEILMIATDTDPN